ncbi:hypothetical protein [Capnocytophaga canimorsus]|uniref:hypothetical protein n=1 Tax=Capnocytophaga canimorsus TaxID=28188 RepID=UPI000F4F5F96|nr:hypothetical protein [Capnocytophaga canimorsus]AYW36665.1 hypothetical protein D8L92_04655 [Capnocytophaga canimorsus]
MVIDNLLEKIDDYWSEYVYDDISFMKKEVLFISEFLPFINLKVLPINEEDINTQLENIYEDNDTFFKKSKELNTIALNKIHSYKKIVEMSYEEQILRQFIFNFFPNNYEDGDLIVEKISHILLDLGISEDLIIEKLYKHFGDILSDNAPTAR